jgi:hypothetical protein
MKLFTYTLVAIIATTLTLSPSTVGLNEAHRVLGAVMLLCLIGLTVLTAREAN